MRSSEGYLTFPYAVGEGDTVHEKKALKSGTQRVHVALWYILGPLFRYMGTPLGPKYEPYTYMDPLGKSSSFFSLKPSFACEFLLGPSLIT